MARKMRHAPVYFTIVQVRFNPVMALDDYAPKIQDRMRHSGFPDLQRSMMSTFNLNMAQGEAVPNGQVPVSQTARYTFSNMSKTAGFVLDHGSLSYQTTDYDVFDTFSETFMQGLSIVHDVIRLDYTDRVGVRYLDAVYPENGEEIARYLNPSLLGLYGQINGALGHTFSETFIRAESANIVARMIIQDGPIGLPPDLQPMWLLISERFRALHGVHAILDTDGSQDARAPFDIEDLKSRLKIVHEAVITSFRAAVTQHAIDCWE